MNKKYQKPLWPDSIKAEEDDDESEKKEAQPACSIWLDNMSSCSGTVLASLLANVMTEGLTVDQKNTLGNFISAVGALISYKASVDED